MLANTPVRNNNERALMHVFEMICWLVFFKGELFPVRQTQFANTGMGVAIEAKSKQKVYCYGRYPPQIAWGALQGRQGWGGWWRGRALGFIMWGSGGAGEFSSKQQPQDGETRSWAGFSSFFMHLLCFLSFYYYQILFLLISLLYSF